MKKECFSEKKNRVYLGLIMLAVMIWFGIMNPYKCQAEPANAMELVKEMKAGWNLGNSLECTDHKRTHEVKRYETLWGNPVVTEEDIIAVKKAGFRTVRVPVTYYDHCDNNGNIDKEWLDRVEEVVNYVLKNDMYCVLTVHHDTGENAWITTNPQKLEKNSKILENLWKQISTRFQNYNYKLVFEGMNEILDSKNQWGGSTAEDYNVVNELNQVFVDTVRKCGGNNANRFLVTNVYASSVSESVMAAYKLPKDFAINRIIVDIHDYEKTAERQDVVFNLINKYFISKNIPVIIGEYGINTTSGTSKSINEYVKNIISRASEKGITCFWWDDGTKMRLLQRGTKRWFWPSVVKNIVELSGGTSDVVVPGAEGSEDFEEAKPGSAYTPLQWLDIKSAGEGFKIEEELDSSCELELGAAFTVSSQYADLLYSGASSSRRIQFRQEIGKLAAAYGWYNENVFQPELNKKFILQQKGNLTYVNGKLVQKASKQTFDTGDKITLSKGKFRVYYCKIWKNGRLVYNLIPAIDCNNVLCLVDQISGKFYYTSQGKEAGDKGTVVVPTIIPEPTSAPVATATPVPTKIPVATATPVPTKIPETTATPVPTKIPVATATPIPTKIPEPTITPVPTKSPESTVTPVKRLEYIETVDSNSTIDTGVFANSNTSVTIEVMSTDLNSYGYFIQGYTSSVNRMQIRQEKNKLVGAYGWYNETLGSINEKNKVTVKIEKNQYWLNNQKIFTASKQSFQNTATLKLMQTKGRVYSCKIWNDGKLIRDYLPMLDSNNVAGFWDNVEKKMYYSQGKNYLYKEENVPIVTPNPTSTPKPTSIPKPTSVPVPTSTPKPTSIPKPTSVPVPTSTPKPTSTPMPTNAPVPTSTPKPTSTPMPTSTPVPTPTPNAPQIQRLEYVEVTDTKKCLDTGVYPDNATSVYMKISLDNLNTYGNIFWGDTTVTKRLQVRQEKNMLYAAYGWYNEKIATIKANTIMEIKIDKNKFIFNNELIRTANEQNFKSTMPIKFMGTRGKIYACKIWENGHLIKDYIPARTQNGDIGLYETLKGNFYKLN